MKLFTIHDSKASYHFNPLTFRSTGEALRSFEQISTDAKSQISLSPSDFTLMEIGTFDPISAEIELLNTPTIIINASEFKEQ